MFIFGVVVVIVSAWKMTKKMAMAKNELAIIDGRTTESAEKKIYMVKTHTHTQYTPNCIALATKNAVSSTRARCIYLYGQRDATSIRHF